MKKIKIAIIILFIILLISMVVVFCLLKTNKLEINNYSINENFENIEIVTNTADIELVLSENNSVVCNEYNNQKHLVKVKGDTLSIKFNDTRKWYEYLGVNFKSPKITIYLSKDDYDKLFIESDTGDITIPKDFEFSNMKILADTGEINNYASVNENIKVKTSTGDIYVEKIKANKIDFSTSTGDIDIVDVDCTNDIKTKVSTGHVNIKNTNVNSIISNGSTGNIFLNNVIAREKFVIERSTGNVKFKDSDAGDIFVKTDTGNISGNLLTDKVFFVESDTGSIDVPKILADQKCEIITDTGDVSIKVK